MRLTYSSHFADFGQQYPMTITLSYLYTIPRALEYGADTTMSSVSEQWLVKDDKEASLAILHTFIICSKL